MTSLASPAPAVRWRAGALLDIKLSVAVGVLIGFFALDAVLLLGFLGWPPLMVAALAIALPLGIGRLAARSVSASVSISAGTLASCLAIAAVLLLLGGEGRLFFATPDWQIRDALLADMGRNVWPFDYWLDGQSKILRAPLGMYLVPALLGGASQFGRDWALFGHNLVLLTLLFAIGSTLFDDARARRIAAAVFIVFSGWDAVGTAGRQLILGDIGWDRIEHWAVAYQYSAHITQIFWVPQHAMAGWACALTFMLWRRGMVSVGVFAATLPLIALWSPLAVMGTIPFALFAGASALFTRRWDGRDVALAAVATAIAVPALIYLGADAQKLHAGPNLTSFTFYVMMMLVEVTPLVVPLLFGRSDRATLAVATACLLLMPLWRIGESMDFQMRASIMPLALVALMLGDWVGKVRGNLASLLITLSLTLGGITGTFEIMHAFQFRSTPPPRCTLAEAWAQQSGGIASHDGYFAATPALPHWLLAATPADRANRTGPVRCWDRNWTLRVGDAG